MNQRAEEKPNEVVRRSQWMLERFKLATESHSRNKNYQFWQYGNHPEEIYSTKFMWSKLDYIHLNPVKDKIVVLPEDYYFSSARNYAGLDNELEIILLDLF